ncbi:hypothetical protein BDZ89DRAFT_1157673 [Hymenopellis radicata]|nr:hypothetical protein BDZ89DRAFT_1157673 [Hymenopellis radicata]
MHIQLAQELIDKILSELDGHDLKTARTCCLVHSSFLPGGRRILFKTVNLNSRKAFPLPVPAEPASFVRELVLIGDFFTHHASPMMSLSQFSNKVGVDVHNLITRRLFSNLRQVTFLSDWQTYITLTLGYESQSGILPAVKVESQLGSALRHPTTRKYPIINDIQHCFDLDAAEAVSVRHCPKVFGFLFDGSPPSTQSPRRLREIIYITNDSMVRVNGHILNAATANAPLHLRKYTHLTTVRIVLSGWGSIWLVPAHIKELPRNISEIHILIRDTLFVRVGRGLTNARNHWHELEQEILRPGRFRNPNVKLHLHLDYGQRGLLDAELRRYAKYALVLCEMPELMARNKFELHTQPIDLEDWSIPSE